MKKIFVNFGFFALSGLLSASIFCDRSSADDKLYFMCVKTARQPLYGVSFGGSVPASSEEPEQWAWKGIKKTEAMKIIQRDPSKPQVIGLCIKYNQHLLSRTCANTSTYYDNTEQKSVDCEKSTEGKLIRTQ